MLSAPPLERQEQPARIKSRKSSPTWVVIHHFSTASFLKAAAEDRCVESSSNANNISLTRNSRPCVGAPSHKPPKTRRQNQLSITLASQDRPGKQNPERRLASEIQKSKTI